MIQLSIGEKMGKYELNVLGAGFACLDVIRADRKEEIMLGGTAANVLTILAILGIKTKFLTARYSGEAGLFMEKAFARRGVQCVIFIDTKNQPPRVIERFENGRPFFDTICPVCGQNLVKSVLPNLNQIYRVDELQGKAPNVFFFDRLSAGIREYAILNKTGWNVYEPNSCRMYTNLISGIRIANIVKYSEDRIPASVTNKVIADIRDSEVALLIITMGEGGIKYIYRTKTGAFSDWNYIEAVKVDNMVDGSGAGDWLSAIFLYFLLKKLPSYTPYFDGEFVKESLLSAQRYAARNCSFLGAQGMLKEADVVEEIGNELGENVKTICDSPDNWKCDCGYCLREKNLETMSDVR